MQPEWNMLKQHIQQCMLFQRRNFTRRLKKLRLRHKQGKSIDDALRHLQKDIEKSKAQLLARKANLPAITYPEDLPVSQKRQDIAQAIQANQVTIIAGETGSGKTTLIRDLVKNCLRMRPDRIVVGECRGGEALDMLQAMNTGHDGSLTTAHANNPRDALSRIETMVLMAGMDLPSRAIREQMASAINLIISDL